MRSYYKNLLKNKLFTFSRSALFYKKTRFSLKYLLNDCRSILDFRYTSGWATENS